MVVAETVQYFAGLDGALWLHVPLGVLTVAGLVVQFIAVWRPTALQRGPGRPRSRCVSTTRAGRVM